MIEWISLVISTIAVIHSIGVRHLQIKTNKEIYENTKTNNKNFKTFSDSINITDSILKVQSKNNFSNWLKVEKLVERIEKIEQDFDTMLNNLNDENGNFNDKFTEINNELCKIVSDIERIKKERRIEKYGENNI